MNSAMMEYLPCVFRCVSTHKQEKKPLILLGNIKKKKNRKKNTGCQKSIGSFRFDVPIRHAQKKRRQVF